MAARWITVWQRPWPPRWHGTEARRYAEHLEPGFTDEYGQSSPQLRPLTAVHSGIAHRGKVRELVDGLLRRIQPGIGICWQCSGCGAFVGSTDTRTPE